MISFKHECDDTHNTNVIQARDLITFVNTTFKDRLIAARERAKLTQAQLAQASGVSQSAIGNYESGARESSRQVVKLASALGVSPQWLADGRGSMDGGAQTPNAPAAQWPFEKVSAELMAGLSRDDRLRVEGAIMAALGHIHEVPVPTAATFFYSTEHGGERLSLHESDARYGTRDKQPPLPGRTPVVVPNVSPGASNDDDAEFEPVLELPDVRLAAGAQGFENHCEHAGSQIQFKRSFLRQAGAGGGRARVVYARGDSMAPAIPDGAALLFVPVEDATLRDAAHSGVWALNYNGTALVKTIARDDSGAWVARSINADYADIPLEGEDVRVLGRIVWVGAQLGEGKEQWVRRTKG